MIVTLVYIDKSECRWHFMVGVNQYELEPRGNIAGPDINFVSVLW